MPAFLNAVAAWVLALDALVMAVLMAATRPVVLVTPCRLTETLILLPSENPGPAKRISVKPAVEVVLLVSAMICATVWVEHEAALL